MDFILIQFLEGLASASSLFLVAAGLSLIFGVTRIVNFAHGSLYMLGAYLAWSLTKPFGFWVAVPVAALTVGALGAALEMGLLRRVYRAPELFQLLATFAVTLIVDDLVPLIWGPQDLLGPRAPGLTGAVEIFDHQFPLYDLFLIGLGPLVMALLWLLLKRTRFGVLLRAASGDRDMVAALGVNQAKLFTAVFALGATLAGLGGALELPRMAINHQMGSTVVVAAFVVVVVGGLDSLVGAFLAAALMGQLSAFGIVLFPKATLVLMFAVMALVLVVRPRGLLGSPELTLASHPAGTAPLVASHRFVQTMLATLAALTLLPLVAGDYTLGVASEILILSLFAGSLLLVTGLGGMTSFGHAAWFGIGAYTAALTHDAVGMLGAIFLAPLTAGLIAFGFARIAVRLSGVYLAMVTLAFAEIVHSFAVQSYDITGGDNGIIGVWPDEWARDPVAFYYLTLLLAGTALALLWRLHGSPFGYGLRAVRDSQRRAEALGINAARQRWYGFACGAGLAGAAGGLFAFLKGSVFPDVAAISTSVDALVMMLLGGMGSIAGPLVGATAYTLMRLGLTSHTDIWRMVVGAVIVVLVLAFPGGLLGARRR
jgi:branched-chain amino acid transport system permease protein